MPTTEPATISTQPATTTTEPTTTTTIATADPLVDFASGEPFRFSFADVDDVPELPSSIPGWEAYTGEDSGGYSGLVRRSEVRVFEGGGLSVINGFATQMRNCATSIWIARWVVLNPDVRVIASNELDPIMDPSTVQLEPWMLPPEAPAGFMGGSICFQPGFLFVKAVNGNASNLADVVVEWSYFDRDPFAGGGDQGSDSGGSSASQCSDYVYDDSLPIAPCSQGYSVTLFQEALGLDADGYFGPGTEAAVRDFQSGAGLPVTGIMDVATWAAIGVMSNAPFPDLNGDGVIDGSEVPFD